MIDRYPFDLFPLRFPYSALQPHISEASLREHHAVHLAGCVKKLNTVLEQHPRYQSWPLDKLVKNCRAMPPKAQVQVKNSAACVYCHNFLFNIVSPERAVPESALKRRVCKYFGSMDEMYRQFKDSALRVHGSGYTWLAMNSQGHMLVVNTTESILAVGLRPLMAVDMWEHAYFLQYKNNREAYVDHWLQVISWPAVLAYLHHYVSHP